MTRADGYRLLLALPPGPCILCHGQSRLRVVFEPYRSDLYGARPGRGRLLRYDICDTCKRRPDEAEAAEAMLFAGARGVS